MPVQPLFDAAAALPLPLTPDAVTANWLTAALRVRRPGVSVAEAEIVDIIYGTSTKIRVRARYHGEGSEDLPPSLIVKGSFEEHSPRMAPMYANEARFYADVLPYISIPSSVCYFAGSDPSSHQSIVIMEDLKREGVIFCNALKPQSFDQVARRIDVMARYHAETWESPEFEAGGGGPTYAAGLRVGPSRSSSAISSPTSGHIIWPHRGEPPPRSRCTIENG